MFQSAVSLLCCPSLWLLLTTALLFHWLYTLWRMRNMPPGPMPLPIIGNAISLYNQPDDFLFQKFVTLGKKYGSVMTVSAGPMTMVVLNDIEAIRDALVRNANQFAGRPKSHVSSLFSDGYKDVAFADFGPVWQLQRKIAGAALRQYLSGSALETVVHSSVGRVCDRLLTETAAVNPREYMYLIMYNIISGILFSKHYELDDPEFKRGLNISHEQFKYADGLWADMFPFMWYLPLAENKGIKALASEAFEVFYAQCDEHRKTFDSNHIRDLMDFLLLEKMKADESEEETVAKQLTDIHINQLATDVFFAGTDTSALTLLWTLLYVAGNPELQERVHEEIDRVVGEGRPPTLAQRKELHFCEAVVYEAMRIRPIAPLSLPHSTNCDVQIGKYTIPKDTMVFPNIWAVHHDPRYWKNSEVFDPENFLEERGGSSKPESFLPFSTGRRVCLGEAIAKPEVVLIFACLLQRFRIALPEGEKPDYSLAGGATGIVPKDYKLVFAERV